jgi:hypothetical protein
MALDLRKLERTLEEQAAKLPVDTPLDQRRRHRRFRRAGLGVVVLVGLGVLAVLVGRRLLSQQPAQGADAAPSEAGPAPDAFGAAVDRAEPVVAASP